LTNLISSSTRIPILICFDANYANYAAVATYSAYKNSKSTLIFFWLFTSECENYAKKLKEFLKKFGILINLISFNILLLRHWKITKHLTSATYLRLFAPDLLASEDKLLYLDCDTIVLKDVVTLYDTPLNGALFAGVLDNEASKSSKIPRIADDYYINTGVLLMDLKTLRKCGFVEQIKSLYKHFENQITWLDQCLINKYAEGQKFLLDHKWNCQIRSGHGIQNIEDLKILQNASILHFVGRTKPWHNLSDPYIAKIWLKYANDLQNREL
jgi:lipopolysaccharide biosynthesis glycosyltransferase